MYIEFYTPEHFGPVIRHFGPLIRTAYPLLDRLSVGQYRIAINHIYVQTKFIPTSSMDSLEILKLQKLFTVSIKRDISRAVALPWFCPFKWRILPRHPFPSKVFNKNQSQTVCPFEKKGSSKKGTKREPSHEFAKRAVHNIVVHITFGVLVRF